LFAPVNHSETENVFERPSAEVEFFCVSHLPQPVAPSATRLFLSRDNESDRRSAPA
jgi:hypothetical protein